MPSVTHEVRNSLIDPTRTFKLDENGVSWSEPKGSQQRGYSDITSVHLISYPNTGGLQYQCTLADRTGKKTKIRSHHYVSLGNFEDRSDSYGPFIRELVARLGSQGHAVKFYQGSNIMRAVWTVLFTLSVLILVGYVFALIGGAGRSWGVIAPMTVIALFLPVTWTMIGRSVAGTFDPKTPPSGLLGN